MKKNIPITVIAVLVVMTVVVAIVACNKENNLSENMVTKSINVTNNAMLIFENFDEFNDVYEQTISMDEKDRKVWEECHEFKSFGRECDELYQSIDPEKFQSISDVKCFVEKNKDYLQLIEDYNGEYILETQLYGILYKYIINKDKLFGIDNMVYKVFDEGMIYTGVDNMGNLCAIENYNYFINNIEHDTTYKFIDFQKIEDESIIENCGSDVSDRNDNGDERIYINITAAASTVGTSLCHVEASYIIRPYHRVAGVWYWCTRILNARYDVIVYVKLASNYWSFSNRYTVRITNQEAKVIQDNFVSGIFYMDGYVGSVTGGFSAFNCWGRSANTSNASLQCNLSLLSSGGTIAPPSL